MDFSELKNDLIVNKSIDDLLSFINNILYNINSKIIQKESKIDFYDLFYYIILYNSTHDNTHRAVNSKFCIDNQIELSENIFINKLIKLDTSIIKNINDKLIKYFYEYFKINTNTLICASDGSNIKLLANLKNNYKLNKNQLYTNATISCLYDVNNQIPISFDIFKSFNEVDNLIKQFDDEHIKNNNYKITCVTDRGYDDKKLINFYVKNNILFVARLTKNNKYIKNFKNTDANNTFETIVNDKKVKLNIIKYTNVEKPNFPEQKEELLTKINEIQYDINTEKNCRIDLKTKINNIKKNNKIHILNIKNNLNDKEVKKNLNKQIVINRAINTTTKNKLNQVNENIKKMEHDKLLLKAKYKNLIDYEHSDYYILTNNLELTNKELKKIYKQRWIIETSYKFDKFKLNLNQMNNKNPQIIKHNIYAIQFIQIINAFIQQILKKYVKTNYHLNINHIYDCLYSYLFTSFHKLLKFKKRELEEKKEITNKKINKFKISKKKKKKKNNFVKHINKKIKNSEITIIILTLTTIIKNQIKYKETTKITPRIKKRQSNNKFNYRNIAQQ